MAENDDLIYKANLNIEDILSGLRKVDKSTEDTAKKVDAHFKKAGKSISGLFIDVNGRVREANGRFSAMGNEAVKAGKKASESFDHVGKSASASGVQIGAISGVVGALTHKFLELGQRAIGALVNVGKESVDLAKNLEVIGKVFTGIFQGNKDAAMAALGEIRKESRALGVDLTETAANFAPFVSSVEQIKRLGKIGAALGLAQPEQVASGGVRIALQEALSGNASSLVRRFEIPKEFGKKLQAALDEGGIEAFLTKFEEVLKLLGRDLDTLGGGLQQAQGRAQVAGQQIQEAFGGPVVKELAEQLDTLAKVVNENFDDFELIADTFGRVLARITEIVGSGLTDFLSNLDTEQVIEIAESLFDMVENARDLAEVLLGVDFGSSFVDNLQFAVDSLNTALETAIKLSLLAQAEIAKQQAEQAALSEALGSGARRGTFGQISAGQATPEQEAAAAAAGEKAYNDVIKNGAAIIEESTKRKEENRQATDDLAASQKKNTDASLDEADAFLQQREAAEVLEEAKQAAIDAQDKVNEALADAKQDFDRKLQDIDIAAERKRLDIQIEFAQKREDAARNNLQKLADIRLKNNQDIDDAATDLGRKEQDIARKFADERIDLERDQRQSRLDIETSFRQKLEDIQKQSAFDLEEAERNRDAIGFLRILRQQQQQVSTAQTDRQREIDELRVNGELKKEELRIQQQREIEEAHIANERKLEDLRLNLDRQIEAQNTAYAQQIEDIAINEARKNEEAARARERDIEDAKLAYDRKLADLQVSLAEELAIIAAGNAAIEAEAKRHADEMAAIAAQERASAPVRDTGRPSSRPGAQNIQQQYAAQPASRPGAVNQGRAFGGLVNAGQSYPVGERGPELFTPSSNGKIIPSNQLLMPSMTPKSAINNVTNNNSKSASLGGLLDANNLDGILAAKVQNILLQMLDRMG